MERVKLNIKLQQLYDDLLDVEVEIHKHEGVIRELNATKKDLLKTLLEGREMLRTMKSLAPLCNGDDEQ